MTEPLRVLIVDDEPLALDYMDTYWRPCRMCSWWAVPQWARRWPSSKAGGRSHVFGYSGSPNGLDWWRRQSDVMPVVVFATAYDEYAVLASQRG